MLVRTRTFTRGLVATGAALALGISTLGAGIEEASAVSPAEKTASKDTTSFTQPDKSFAVYIGKDRTEDGYTLLGGFGHEPSSHWVEVVPEQDHESDDTIVVGASEEAYMPGEITEIPQVEHTYRYITSNYTEFTGLPSPLTNGGLNENGVAARDVWSNSRPELVDMTPTDQTGPQYSDLSRIAMERAETAEDAVMILGDLIDEYGYTTYGGNSHLFADEDEGWVFVEYAGGEGLWAAERLGADEVRVSYPGYIHDFPVEAAGDDEHADYRGSENLVTFAEDQGWYDADEDDVFNLQDVYQEDFPTDEFDIGEVASEDDEAPYRNPVALEKEFAELDDAKLEDAMRIVRDPRWSDERSGYGHVAQIEDDLEDAELRTLWVAPTAAATAPYIPIAIGMDELPVEYSQHRYLTEGASEDYLEPEFAEQEATEYATQTFKRLMYATCSRPDAGHLPEVTAALEGFDAESISAWSDARSNEDVSELNTITNERAIDGLKLGDYLLTDLVTRLADDGGIHEPDVEKDSSGQTASNRSLSMSLRSDASSRDRMSCDMGGGWEDGSSTERAGTYGDPDDIPDYSSVSLPGHPADNADVADSSVGGIATWLWGVIGVVVGVLFTAIFTNIKRRPKGESAN